jgi:ribosomal protein S18 acetylase RimI-like enzyme
VNPELQLCPHFYRLRLHRFQPDVVHSFAFQSGVIDAIVRCKDCDAHALMRLADWAPPDYTLRVYTLAALRPEDSALYIRNTARGSCQISRINAEVEALVAAAGPVQVMFAADTRRERVIAAGRLPPHLAAEPGPFPERLPLTDDVRWFAILGMDKLDKVKREPPKLTIEMADFAKPEEIDAFLGLVDAYSRDPMGAGRPLGGDAKMRLIPDLKARMLAGDALVLIARRGEKPVGVAVCWSSYSTFQGRPVLNLHDLAVVPEERGTGVGHQLLDAVEDAARARRCCKITLEVREDNLRARAIYERAGYLDYSPGDGERVRTLFIEKTI